MDPRSKDRRRVPMIGQFDHSIQKEMVRLVSNDNLVDLVLTSN